VSPPTDAAQGRAGCGAHESRDRFVNGEAGTGREEGEAIGRSGSTGLAAGDHLHFSTILQGVQVDAREWWDPHWIRDRIAAKLTGYKTAETPPAVATPPSSKKPAKATPKPRKPKPKPKKHG
jgi:murein DD-endopeptidase MepM/ murein hydrolase activator NlpD